MVDEELEARSRLVARARQKAEREGTTLELKVESWLMQYVNDQNYGKQVHEPIRQLNGEASPFRAAPPGVIMRAMKSFSGSGSSERASRDTRSEAYRRLLGVISDSSKRTS